MPSGQPFNIKWKVEKFDAIIIGSGQAGNPLAKRLSGEGWRVALVEKAHVGGTCINYGCTPTKTLVGVAKTIRQARRASDYGIILHKDVPDYRLIDQYKNEVVAGFRQRLEGSLAQDPNITLYHGEGRFSGYKEVRVQLADLSVRYLAADSIFINTGARAHIPDIEGLWSVNYLTSQTVLALKDLPDHLLILGGGSVALEFSQIFRRMGSQVTIIEKSSRLLPGEDEDVGLEMHRLLEEEGVKILTDASVQRIDGRRGAVRADLLSEGKTMTISGTHLLVATGRTPNTDALDLSKTRIQVDEKGFIPVSAQLETAEQGIYALGDVKGGPAFTHVSYHDYIVVTDNLLGKKSSSIRHRLVPYCVFTDPELGRIGLSETEATGMGLDFSVAKMKTSFIARALETGESRGFIKALVDNKTHKILGVAVISPNGGELMSLLQVAMLGGLRYDQLRDTMFAHPTYAEAVNNLFSSLHLNQKEKHDQYSPGE